MNRESAALIVFGGFRMRLFRWTLLLLVCAPVMAIAQPAVVRLGAHPGLGRVVFEFSQPTEVTTDRSEDSVTLHFSDTVVLPETNATTRNVLAVTSGSGTATIAIVPDARLHMARIGNRVVLDVMDPAPTKRALNQPGPGRVEPKLAHPVAPLAASLAVPSPSQATLPLGELTPAQAEPSPRVSQAPPPQAQPTTPSNNVPETTLAVAASPVASPAGVQGNSVVLPFGASVAAAAFRHGPEAWIVFDERRPLDLANLASDAAFKSAVVQVLPAATLLRVTLPVSTEVRLERRPDGWMVIATDSPTSRAAMMPITRSARFVLPAPAPGQVVAVPDSETGSNLLVGTVKVTGTGVPVGIRVPEFSILPSWQGLVVEAFSDRTNLRSIPEGFAIETGDTLSPMPENGTALANAAGLTRRFDFPSETTPALLRRLQSQVQEIGEAPPQARIELRKAAAQTMLALGLGAEAQSLLRLAVEEDPRAMADPEVNGLAAVAALVNNRPQEANGLDAPELSGSDEVALWRAVRLAMTKHGASEAAPAFAATAAMVVSYPTALRNRLLPIAAEAMADGGAPQAVDALLASLPDEPSLAFARAIRLEQKGEVESALNIYDALASGRDRLASSKASRRAVMLRLATGRINAAEAAAALERNFLLWRGDGWERDLRLQTADLEVQAAEWRKAIDTLKETARLFPADSAMIAARITAVLSDLLHGPNAASITPLDLVALADENADAIAETDVAGMGLLLADDLTALDLPDRAAPVIEHMAAAAPAGAGKARLGARLAALRLGEGDLAGATNALVTTDAAGLPAPLQEERNLIDARIHAQMHDTAGATTILSGIGTQAAEELRATVLADSGDWLGAAQALQTVVTGAIPEAGALDARQQDLLLRLASAQSRLADEASLHALGLKQAARMTGARGKMFRLLTDAPVSNVGDLGRVADDIALARALPGDLNTLGAK